MLNMEVDAEAKLFENVHADYECYIDRSDVRS